MILKPGFERFIMIGYSGQTMPDHSEATLCSVTMICFHSGATLRTVAKVCFHSEADLREFPKTLFQKNHAHLFGISC